MRLEERTKPMPHQLAHRSRNGWKALFSGISASSLITLGFMQVLFAMNIPITVILPTSAPIWVGVATMFFLCLKD